MIKLGLGTDEADPPVDDEWYCNAVGLTEQVGRGLAV